jgi:hypothetical protein
MIAASNSDYVQIVHKEHGSVKRSWGSQVEGGIAIILEGQDQSVNPFSRLQIEPIEGGDMAYGPFQILSIMDDAAQTIRISPAPYTKELSAQVRCAEKDWPYFVKFFACPFL